MTQTQTKQKTCAELISARCYDRKEQFENALLFFKDKDETKKNRKNSEFSEYESLMDYASQNSLDFSYIEPNTFKKQSEGYWRWQLSWGGPSDEFRYYHYDGDRKKSNQWSILTKTGLMALRCPCIQILVARVFMKLDLII